MPNVMIIPMKDSQCSFLKIVFKVVSFQVVYRWICRQNNNRNISKNTSRTFPKFSGSQKQALALGNLVSYKGPCCKK